MARTRRGSARLCTRSPTDETTWPPSRSEKSRLRQSPTGRAVSAMIIPPPSSREAALHLTVSSTIAMPGSLDARGSYYRDRRSSQRRQVDALQRVDQEQRSGGELPVRDDRAEH